MCELLVAGRYRRCRGIETLNCESEGCAGCASSNNAALPHSFTTQSGASRSEAPAKLLRLLMFLEARKSGSVNWYLSMKRYEGKVRWVWSLHVGFGEVRCWVGKERTRVGCRPVGCWKLAL